MLDEDLRAAKRTNLTSLINEFRQLQTEPKVEESKTPTQNQKPQQQPYDPKVSRVIIVSSRSSTSSPASNSSNLTANNQSPLSSLQPNSQTSTSPSPSHPATSTEKSKPIHPTKGLTPEGKERI